MTHTVDAVSDLDVTVVNQQTLSVSWTGVESAERYFILVSNYSGDIATSRSMDRQQIGNQYFLQISGISKDCNFNIVSLHVEAIFAFEKRL